jgi:hypothetical protein
MALLVPNDSENLMLKNILNHTAPQNQTLKLFSSNTTPAETDTAGTYTEATFTGYSAVGLTGTSWVVTGDTAAYAEQTFTSTAVQSQTIYGYYIIQAVSGLLLWSERFSSPIAIANNGDAIKLTPTITLA